MRQLVALVLDALDALCQRVKLDVRRLKVLREVAAHGSFSAAAESLAFTQPAVSRQIATLEAEAGTRLVERSARGVRLTQAGLARQQIDATLVRYVGNIMSVGLTIGLIVALMGYFGFETTSFAALIAGVGIAIGAAWAGLLANFAAGAFLVVLRPFRVGHYIKVAGVEGTVTEIGLFATTISTPDHVAVFIGNNKVFGDTIHNYSTSPTRRVERTAQLAHSVDVNDAIARLKEAIVKVPNVAKTPEPVVEIVDFTNRGPVLAVRPYTHTAKPTSTRPNSAANAPCGSTSWVSTQISQAAVP